MLNSAKVNDSNNCPSLQTILDVIDDFLEQINTGNGHYLEILIE